MTTDLAQTLRQLASHLHHLEEELQDQPLKAPRYSQTDSRKTHSGPTPPTNLTTLDYLQNIAPIIKGWCYNLAADTHAAGLPLNQPLPTWVAWLHRNTPHLTTTPWAEDCAEELTDLEAELRAHIHPQDPNPLIEQRQTSRSIIHRLRKMGHTITPAQLRGWARYGHITAIELQDGRNGYLISEVLNHITKETPA